MHHALLKQNGKRKSLHKLRNSPKKFFIDNGGEFNNEDFHSLCENPTALNFKLLTLEGKLSSEVVASNISAMHAARQAFIQSESSDRIRHALLCQTRTSGDIH